MRFSCSQSTLVKALNIVSKAVTSRTTIPILKGILIKVDEEGFITMSSSDLDISIEDKFEVVDFEPGEIVVQAKLFGDIIRKLPSEIIYIEENEGNLIIRSTSSEFNIVGSPSDEFPKINLGEQAERITFDKELLKEMIKKTSFAASVDESRGVITGVLLEMKEDSLNMVALDGFRMAVSREYVKNGKEQNIIIPARTLNEVAKIISESETEEEYVDLLLNEKRAVFVIGNIKVVVRLLDGEYVKYNDILPKESQLRIVLNRNNFMEAIERASLFAKVGKNNLIKLNIMENELEITSKSEEGNVRENVYISREGKDLVIGFNSKYLLDSLKAVEDENISMLFNTPISPCLIRPLEGNEYEYLVLPVRITNI
ncbi:MAG: DNA polymerase III subunit beta [Lachnospiraceae bacterium]|nr:DNA polymerase III subunit beta [Lachnospiraceae bacterium]